MKSVWILERWETPEDMQRNLQEMERLAEEFREEDPKIEKGLERMRTRVAENPDGMWVGWEGKTIYQQFCYVAREALRRADKGDKFRVVKAEIQDDAKTWVGYKNGQENAGVMRYLRATA